VDSFWRDAWTSFKAVFGPVLAGAAIVLALLGPPYAPAAVVRISLIWLAVAGLLALTVLLTAGNLVVAARRLSNPRLPRLISVYFERRDDAEPGDLEEETVLLLEPSELFGYDGVVSIYCNQRLGGADARPFERLIGVGRVSNIQEGKIIAVTVLRYGAGHDTIWSRIRVGETAALSDIRAKPTVPFRETGLGATVNG